MLQGSASITDLQVVTTEPFQNIRYIMLKTTLDVVAGLHWGALCWRPGGMGEAISEKNSLNLNLCSKITQVVM